MLIHTVLYHTLVGLVGWIHQIDSSFWKACRSECLSIQRNCGPIPNLNCDDYEENDYFCYRVVKNVFIFILIEISPNFNFPSLRVIILLSLCMVSLLGLIFCYCAVLVISYTMEIASQPFTSSLLLSCH